MSVGLLLIDPQLDFFPGGALAVPHGDAIVAPINALLHAHPECPVFVSRDWHPSQTKHFSSAGGRWPVHCVADSEGARFHPALSVPSSARIYNKGVNPDDDAGYSAFEGTNSETGRALIDDMRDAGVDTVIVSGLATDYCVKASVLAAREHGLFVIVVVDAVRAVNIAPSDGDAALSAMAHAGAMLVSSLTMGDTK